MLGAQVVTGAPEQLARQRLGALHLAERDEHLAHADERTGLAGGIPELAPDLHGFLECLERSGLVAGVVDAGPAERVKGRCELVPLADLTPEADRLVESCEPELDVSASGRQGAERAQCSGA